MGKKEKQSFKLEDHTKMEDLASYQEIKIYLKEKKTPINLLLGNGFSISYNKDIFSYNALSNFIENLENENLKKLFNISKTKNFEEVMENLNMLSEFITVFNGDKKILNLIADANKNLKENLIKAISSMHPEHIFKVTDEERSKCYDFLKDYLTDKIFSTNYDLLFYWVLMSKNVAQTDSIIDGFGYYDESNILEWGKHSDSQNIFYLHGALMLFDEGTRVTKEIYDGEYLLRNIEQRIGKNQYPVFVTAGNATQKLKHITHNKYLNDCYDKLCKINGSIVTLGLSFGENDTHLIDALNRASKQPGPAQLWSVYIGIYSEKDLEHIKKMRKYFNIDNNNQGGPGKLKINVYNAISADIWR